MLHVAKKGWLGCSRCECTDGSALFCRPSTHNGCWQHTWPAPARGKTHLSKHVRSARRCSLQGHLHAWRCAGSGAATPSAMAPPCHTVCVDCGEHMRSRLRALCITAAWYSQSPPSATSLSAPNRICRCLQATTYGARGQYTLSNLQRLFQAQQP